MCHLVLATGYLLRTPGFAGPDEYGHAYYASFLAHRHSLPVVEGSSEPYGLSPWDESPVGHHPPLYYGLLAVTMQVLGHADTVPTFSLAETPIPLHFRHGHDELSPVSAEIVLLWVLRGWSVLLGLITIVLVHRLGRVALAPLGAWPRRVLCLLPPAAAVIVLQLHFTPAFRFVRVR